MNDLQALLTYRLKQAEDTLDDAKKMLQDKLTPRSITNRAYYAMFYSILALFIKSKLDIKTAKHTGVISVFDREYILTGKIEKRYSKSLHRVFEMRLEGDYKDLDSVSFGDARDSVKFASGFVERIKKLIES